MNLPQEYNSVKVQNTGMSAWVDNNRPYNNDTVLFALITSNKYTWWELVLLELVAERKLTTEECLSEIENAHCGD
jgi:hypothetical protein